MTRALPTFTHGRRGGAIIFAFAVFAVIMQLPGNTVIALLLPPLALLYNGIRVTGQRGEWTVWLWLGLMVVPAFVAMISYDVTQERNYFIVVLSLIFFAAFVFRGADGTNGARWLMQALYAGFGVMALVGVFEVITGYKLLFLRYPNSVVASWVDAYRFITTAMYPNYNDFSVALVLLAIFITARAITSATSGAFVQGLRIGAIILMAAWIFYMGSRGALLGLFAGVAVVVFLAVRRRDVSAIPSWLLTTGLSLMVAATVVLSQTTFIQDEDTKARGQILERLWGLAATDPAVVLYGFGSPEQLDRYANRLLNGALVNPHNMFAEVIIWAGIFGLIGFSVCWFYILWQAICNRTGATWFGLAATAATLVMPVLGVTPSVILHYMFPELLMIAAIASFDRVAKRSGGLATSA